MLREFINLPLNEKKQQLKNFSGIKKYRNIRNIEKYLSNKSVLEHLYFRTKGNSKDLSNYFVHYLERFLNDYDGDEVEIIKSFFRNNIKPQIERKYRELAPDIADELGELGVNVPKDRNGFPIIFDISHTSRYDRIRARPDFEEDEEDEYEEYYDEDEDDEISRSVKRLRL